MASNRKIKVIAVVGETASGKTSLAIAIAKKYNGEVICADSRTVFVGMDIGTAKPTKDEMEGVIHYGLDLVEPDQTYSAAMFKEYADKLIIDIHKRGKLPILVGGTGLYIDGILFNYSFGLKIDSEQRRLLNNKSVEELTTQINEMGIIVDNQTKKNKRYLIRIIERDGEAPKNTELAYDALLLGYKLNKNVIRERIGKRVEVMFRKGLRKEYNELRVRFDLNSQAFTGIGYREFIAWENGNASISEVKRHIVKNTMSLAKRQRTWFKRNRQIQWVEDETQALKLSEDFISDNRI